MFRGAEDPNCYPVCRPLNAAGLNMIACTGASCRNFMLTPTSFLQLEWGYYWITEIQDTHVWSSVYVDEVSPAGVMAASHRHLWWSWSDSLWVIFTSQGHNRIQFFVMFALPRYNNKVLLLEAFFGNFIVLFAIRSFIFLPLSWIQSQRTISLCLGMLILAHAALGYSIQLETHV
jgi:hypothetical protein